MRHREWEADIALYWRIWGLSTLVTLAVLTIFVGLATLQFGGINSGLVGERLMVLADRTATPFAASTRLGLPLSTVRNAGALLERARQTDGAILAIHLFDAEGRIVRSTARPVPAAIPPEAVVARSVTNSPTWFREIADHFLVSADIASVDGGTAGGILIVYPDDGNATQIRAMAAKLSLTAIGILLAASALGALLLRLGLHRQIRQFEAVDSSIVDFERDAWRRAAGRPARAAKSGAGDLPDLLEAAEKRYLATGRALADAQGGAR